MHCIQSDFLLDVLGSLVWLPVGIINLDFTEKLSVTHSELRKWRAFGDHPDSFIGLIYLGGWGDCIPHLPVFMHHYTDACSHYISQNILKIHGKG